MKRDFQPFSNLWTIVNKWRVSYDKWMNDPFDTVDAIFAQQFVDESSRILVGVKKYMEEKKFD